MSRIIIHMGKKGTSDQLLIWILRIIMLAGIVVLTMSLVNSTIIKSVQTHGLEYTIIAERAVKCVSYFDDETMSLKTYMIDAKNFNTDFLGKCFDDSRENRTFAIMMTLEYFDGTAEEPTYYRKQDFEDYKPLTWSTKFRLLEITKYVLVKKGDEIKQAKMSIELVYRVTQ